MNMKNIHFLQQKGSGFQNDLRYNGYFCMQMIFLFERKGKREEEREIHCAHHEDFPYSKYIERLNISFVF